MATPQEILDALGNIVAQVGATIDFLIERIGNIIADLLGAVTSAISDFFTGIVDAISSAFAEIARTVTNIFDKIVSTITGFIDSAVQTISTLVDNVIGFISDLAENAGNFLSEVFDTVVDNINLLVTDTLALFSDVFAEIKTQIQSIVDSVVLFFTDIFELVSSGISTIIDQAGLVVGSIVTAIEDFIREVVDVVGSSLRDLLETISDLPATIEALSLELIQSAQENIGKPLEGLALSFITNIKEAAAGEPSLDAERIEKGMLDMLFGRSPVIQSPEEMRDFIQTLIPDNVIGRAVLVPFVAMFLMMQVLGGIASANSQIILQEHALVNPYRIMEPADVVSALHFDLIDKGLATEFLRKTGYTESAAGMLINIGDFRPPAGELVVWWLRDFISDEQFNIGLKKQGWVDEDIVQLRKAAFFIPPVQDLITMAVREVFTPEIAEQFGQFEDFPPEFVKQALKQGVSEEWAKRYWGAHWSLPSVQMGFEMLHRQVVTEDELKLLLRASDVMPFWRDKLVEISFSPLTRVDIRRMHKLEVLSEEQVNKAYHDIGYNDDNAKLLTDFTLRLNASTGGEDDQALGDLTRANIIRFFKDGVFDRQAAFDTLILTGVSEDAAQLFLLSAELELQADFRKDAIDLIIEQAKAGVINFTDAQNQLNALGLEELEKQSAINKLLREQSKQNKLPSKGDLDKMIKAGLITGDEYLDNIQRLGFSKFWSDKFLALTKGGQVES